MDLLHKKRVSPPFLLIDESEIKESLARFRKHLSEARIFYATKANADIKILSLFADEGLSFDVAAMGEIEAVAKLGVSGDRMFLSTPIKSEEAIKGLFAHRIAACAVDSLGELSRLHQMATRARGGFKPKIFVRFKVETKDVAVNLNTKFGCSASEALDIIKQAVELKFDVGGLCFHVGTQCANADNYFLSIRSAMMIAEESSRRFGIRIPVINIGGGFCDPVTAIKNEINIDDFYSSIGKACKLAADNGFEVYAEPGRSLVSSAGILVSSVIGTSVRDGKNWAYLNEGIYGCFSIKLYENTHFSFISLNAANSDIAASSASQWTIAGPTCDSLDVIAEQAELAHSPKIGEIFLTPNMGAYTLATASNFNGFSIASTYILSSDEKTTQKVVQLPNLRRTTKRRANE